ncbi:MAG: hemerythrin domain-containing protein [Candidatus Binatia bacterium]
MAKRHPTLIPLCQDHHYGLALAIRCRKQALGQLNPGNTRGIKERAEEVKDFFLKKLRPHFEAEEVVLFPLIGSQSSDAKRMVTDLFHEHEQIRRETIRLRQEPESSKTLFDLGDLLERHIRREERELFPLFEQLVPPAKAEQAKIKIERILDIRKHSL